MNHLMIKAILNTFKCNLVKSHICDFDGNNKQLFHLTLFYKNCIKVFINDVLVTKQNVYLVSTYKETKSIKVKLVGLFNDQTHFLEVKSKSIDVNFSIFKKKNALSTIEFIHNLSYKKFNFYSLIKQKAMRGDKKMSRTNRVYLTKSVKLETEIIAQNYNLTNITNNYEQANLSNT